MLRPWLAHLTTRGEKDHGVDGSDFPVLHILEVHISAKITEKGL